MANGRYCRNEASRCSKHVRAVAVVPRPSTEHDLRAVGWWVLDGLVSGEVDPRRAGVIATWMRVMASMGPEPMDQEEALAEVELRGLIMHGIPPRNEEEWERARRIFSPESLAEFSRRHAPRYGDGTLVSES